MTIGEWLWLEGHWCILKFLVAESKVEMWLVISIRHDRGMATSSVSRPLSKVLGVVNGGVELMGVGGGLWSDGQGRSLSLLDGRAVGGV